MQADLPGADLPERAWLKDVHGFGEILCPARVVPLPTVCVHTNAGIIDDGGTRRGLLRGLYGARHAHLEPVGLVALPPGALVLGGHSYVLQTAGTLIIDQMWPGVHDTPQALRALLDSPREVVDVDGTCLLVARWGAGTWGHWLGEILPKAVLAERAWPRKFRFCLPDSLVADTPRRSFATAVRESLAAYGIGLDRVVTLDPAKNHRFRDLHAITSVWSSVLPHPDMLDLMRSAIRDIPRPGAARRRLAIMRRDVPRRNIANGEEIERVLREQGFWVTDMGERPFIEQVAAFRDAETVFGVLGSGLTGLVYAPDGVRVVSAAPAMWQDLFFHALIQARGGVYADLLGPSLWDGQGVDRDAPFILHTRHLRAALSAVSRPLTELAPEGVITVCDLELPRLPEALSRPPEQAAAA